MSFLRQTKMAQYIIHHHGLVLYNPACILVHASTTQSRILDVECDSIKTTWEGNHTCRYVSVSLNLRCFSSLPWQSSFTDTMLSESLFFFVSFIVALFSTCMLLCCFCFVLTDSVVSRSRRVIQCWPKLHLATWIIEEQSIESLQCPSLISYPVTNDVWTRGEGQ